MNKDILYVFPDTLVCGEVCIPWNAHDIKAGSPVDINGAVANDGNAVGILMDNGDVGKVEVRGGTAYVRAKIIKAGYVDMLKAQSICGITYSDACKAALSDIIFVNGKFEGGGGGGADPNVVGGELVVLISGTGEFGPASEYPRKYPLDAPLDVEVGDILHMEFDGEEWDTEVKTDGVVIYTQNVTDDDPMYYHLMVEEPHEPRLETDESAGTHTFAVSKNAAKPLSEIDEIAVGWKTVVTNTVSFEGEASESNSYYVASFDNFTADLYWAIVNGAEFYVNGTKCVCTDYDTGDRDLDYKDANYESMEWNTYLWGHINDPDAHKSSDIDIGNYSTRPVIDTISLDVVAAHTEYHKIPKEYLEAGDGVLVANVIWGEGEDFTFDVSPEEIIEFDGVVIAFDGERVYNLSAKNTENAGSEWFEFDVLFDGENNWLYARKEDNVWTYQYGYGYYVTDDYTYSSILVRSSTEGSSKVFEITVDDSGNLSATEVE